ncbi:hypothetical protein KCP73_16770 [Salmonella enterica subsp. enterica]|nr:hypothetical protein KCP73_16770 [Salmonella enterica subsp. enterica]
MAKCCGYLFCNLPAILPDGTGRWIIGTISNITGCLQPLFGVQRRKQTGRLSSQNFRLEGKYGLLARREFSCGDRNSRKSQIGCNSFSGAGNDGTDCSLPTLISDGYSSPGTTLPVNGCWAFSCGFQNPDGDHFLAPWKVRWRSIPAAAFCFAAARKSVFV